MNREIDRARIAWVQAGIKIEMVGPIIHENPPIDPATTQSILHDNWFDTDTTAGLDAKMVADSIGAGATPDVLEVIFTGAIRRADKPFVEVTGVTSIPSVHDPADPLSENTYSFIGIRRGAEPGGTTIDVRIRTFAHEIGHALTNQIDPGVNPPYIYFPQVGLSPLDNTVETRRRIRHNTQTFARRPRQPGAIGAVGNRLLPP